MSNSQLPDIPCFRKQHLFLEYASLKLRCPAGIYLSITPADPSQWSGVFFVRKGPYLPAVIRFNISFPSQYPDHPPLVTFATDIFHPLLVPLTTYTFSTSASDITEADEEKLPPGGFSLRNGFPKWSRRQSRAAGETMDSKARHNDHRAYSGVVAGPGDVSTESPSVPGSVNQSPYLPSWETGAKTASIAEVLDYMKSAFENPAMLDKLPPETAGNPGAWHAWRSHRGLSKHTNRATSPANDGRLISAADDPQPLPSDWNWEGVWENRVRDGIQNSLSDPTLFGPKGGRGGERKIECIRFSKMDHEQFEEIREQAIRMQSTRSSMQSQVS